VDSFRTRVDDDSELECIITAYRHIFQDGFQNSHVEFNRRQANGATYESTRVAPSGPSPSIYDDVYTFMYLISFGQ